MRSRVRILHVCVCAQSLLRVRPRVSPPRCRYTDEFTDAHTRAVLLRGGSNYRPAGSLWYFPQAVELGTHNKYFLMSDSYERAGTIGFRCVTDAQTLNPMDN
jgi:hypothetical protein